MRHTAQQSIQKNVFFFTEKRRRKFLSFHFFSSFNDGFWLFRNAKNINCYQPNKRVREEKWVSEKDGKRKVKSSSPFLEHVEQWKRRRTIIHPSIHIHTYIHIIRSIFLIKSRTIVIVFLCCKQKFFLFLIIAAFGLLLHSF